MGDLPSRTRFGSAAFPLAAAAGVLRARAAREGLALHPVGEVDLAAAVVGVDAWSLVARSGSLAVPARHGWPAVQALAASLARAAGHDPVLRQPELAECAQDPVLVAAAEAHRDLAEALVPGHPGEVLRRAASDLAAAGPETDFMAYAALLLHAA